MSKPKEQKKSSEKEDKAKDFLALKFSKQVNLLRFGHIKSKPAPNCHPSHAF